jgi:redox-sensitive bicupin YhaK (pirin superfamily)
MKMFKLRLAQERSHIQNADQNTWMTFNPENQTDPLKNGFGALKKLNENILSPDMGLRPVQTGNSFLILTYVRRGSVVFKGGGKKYGLLSQNEFQVMNAGPEMKPDGFNASSTEEAHVFQFRFELEGSDLEPGEMKKLFSLAEQRGNLKLIASSDGDGGSLPVHQDLQMYSGLVLTGAHIVHELGPGRRAWLHVVNGKVQLNDMALQTGDGVGFTDEISVSFTAKVHSSLILFDLA